MKSKAEVPLTGRKVALILCSAFAVIIGVNLTLAFKAVATFPGLEVKNSYVASQAFNADRTAQEALGWDVSASVAGDRLTLIIRDAAGPVAPVIKSAVFGRATSVSDDQTPTFRFDGAAHLAAGDRAKFMNAGMRKTAP